MIGRVLIIAGEASGDLHGAGVVRELKKRIPAVEVYGIGGDNMKREGMDLLFHVSELSIMGFIEVIKNLSMIRKVERRLVGMLRQRKPDVVVLIDYPGFNLRFARQVKRYGIKILYYISPQVWAWNKGRVKKMKFLVDRIKVVFPFEVDIYRQEGMDVEFVGHPLAEKIGSSMERSEFFQRHGWDIDLKLLALFPGSRKQEVENILPTMVEAASKLRTSHKLQIAVGVAPNLGVDLLRSYIADREGIVIVQNSTYDLMHHADAAIVTSGTATLETGWFATPMVIVYKTSPVTFAIGRMLVGVPYIGLVNIVAGKKVVPELIQHDLTPDKLCKEVKRLIEDDEYARLMRSELSVIKSKLGGPGASAKVAEGIISLGEAA